ncbi:hypothetical protein [Nocardia sp. NPDC005978]|uniref:hypothetical protein n=1 Tax=unclassified Nocardia TaxID=2637762 RepID=UPI0033AC30E8
MRTALTTARTAKLAAFAAAPLAVAAFATVAVTAAPASAEPSYPGSCLVVQNHTGRTLEITLNYPTHSGRWTFAPDEVSVLTSKGRVVTSPSGTWNVHNEPNADGVWVYSEDRNTSKGCNGSWILTLN